MHRRTNLCRIHTHLLQSHTPSPNGSIRVAIALSGYHPVMRQQWTLDRLIRRHWSITNRSGHTARSITFTASGALVIFDRQGWTTTVDHLETGQGYPVVALAAWGSTIHTPELRVTWFSDQEPGHLKVTTLHWPASAISFPGAPLERHGS